MGNFNVGTVKCDKQMATAYALYMIAGSYFKKAAAANAMMERNLKGQYMELRDQVQEEKEHYVEKLLEKIEDAHRNALDTLHCEVRIKKADGIYYLWFRTGFEELIAFVDPNCRVHIEKGFAISERTWAKVCQLKN